MFVNDMQVVGMSYTQRTRLRHHASCRVAGLHCHRRVNNRLGLWKTDYRNDACCKGNLPSTYTERVYHVTN